MSPSPALDRADPNGALGDPQQVRIVRTAYECLMTDGSWDTVVVLAQAPDRFGGWRVEVQWWDHGMWTGWFLVRNAEERARFREVPES